MVIRRNIGFYPYTAKLYKKVVNEMDDGTGNIVKNETWQAQGTPFKYMEYNGGVRTESRDFMRGVRVEDGGRYIITNSTLTFNKRDKVVIPGSVLESSAVISVQETNEVDRAKGNLSGYQGFPRIKIVQLG